jgi:hypothetical protein
MSFRCRACLCKRRRLIDQAFVSVAPWPVATSLGVACEREGGGQDFEQMKERRWNNNRSFLRGRRVLGRGESKVVAACCDDGRLGDRGGGGKPIVAQFEGVLSYACMHANRNERAFPSLESSAENLLGLEMSDKAAHALWPSMGFRFDGQIYAPLRGLTTRCLINRSVRPCAQGPHDN